MTDPKGKPPSQPSTIQLAQVPDWAVELTRRVVEGFAKQEVRMNMLEERLNEEVAARVSTEARVATHSGMVRQTSDANLKQDAAIGLLVAGQELLVSDMATVKAVTAETTTNLATVTTEIATVKHGQESTAVKVAEVHDAVTGVIKNPKVRAVGRLIFMLAMGYAAAKGMKVLP